jgi:hypothetical protein
MTIDGIQPYLEGAKSTPFLVSGVIAAFEWLGKKTLKLGREFRTAKFEAISVYLSE